MFSNIYDDTIFRAVFISEKQNLKCTIKIMTIPIELQLL